MSTVNSVRYVEGAISDSGSDGVEMYRDPTRSGNNEEEVGNEEMEIKQHDRWFIQNKPNHMTGLTGSG